MKLVSNGACYHPATGLDLPAAGTEYEATDEAAAAHVAAGLAQPAGMTSTAPPTVKRGLMPAPEKE